MRRLQLEHDPEGGIDVSKFVEAEESDHFAEPSGVDVAELVPFGEQGNHPGTGGRVGMWQGADRTSLQSWRGVAFTDTNSIQADPNFVNAAAGDFHVQSQAGSFVSIQRATTTTGMNRMR